ncbi:MAG: hypothetical protein ACOX0U_04970 [Oscillospiraceae bacterium]
MIEKTTNFARIDAPGQYNGAAGKDTKTPAPKHAKGQEEKLSTGD